MAEQSTALATYNGAALEDRLSLIKRVAMAPQTTDDEFQLFITVANKLGLDPLARQIYAIHRKSGTNRDGSDRYQMTIQTGIDGYRALADRTGEYAGSDDPVYDTEDADQPNKATVTVWRWVKGVRCPFTATARWKEYAQKYTDRRTGEVTLTGKWADMPYNQLAKCAEALALRKAFPAQLAGAYVEDEMDQADNPPRTIEPTVPQAATPARTVSEAKATPAPAPAAVNGKSQGMNWSGLRLRGLKAGIATVEDWEAVCIQQTGEKDARKMNTAANYRKVEAYVAGLEAKKAQATAKLPHASEAEAEAEPDVTFAAVSDVDLAALNTGHPVP